MSDASPSLGVDPGSWLDWLAKGWRAPVLSALIVLFSALPALVFLSPLDRDESRFAQATAQMLETHDFVNIRYQSEPRDKKPVGIHWLQAASVSAVSSVEKREIWAYRIPSLLGAMLAAAACAWGASAFFGPRGGLFAGVALACGLLLSSEAFIAKTDAVLCGGTVLMMAALGRLYHSATSQEPLRLREKGLFWGGLALTLLIKGPVGLMVAALALIALAIADRRFGWMAKLGWGWGLLSVAAVVGPWALAITVSTDGQFWTGAVGGDLAPKLRGAHESHGAPPGLHLLLSPILLFPATALLPVALVTGWLRRTEVGVRFALAWLIPSWLVFEALPTKLVHYPLPLYGAMAFLMGAALASPQSLAWNRWTRGVGAVLSVVVGVALAVTAALLAPRYGGGGSAFVWLTGLFAVSAGIAAAAALYRPAPTRLAAVALGLGVAAHISLSGGLAPALRNLWVSKNAANLLASRNLNPSNGVTPGPVAVVGYAEPSLVFLLGTDTELDSVDDAADAVAAGEPALVDSRQDAEFKAALKGAETSATLVGETRGTDYSTGKPVDLLLYRSNAPPPREPSDEDPEPKTGDRPAS